MYYLDPDNFWRDDLDNREVVVSIKCLTYNHEKFIRDALEGFVNQKTNFRFEAIIHDDASTDGTADILREYAEKYPSIIKPIFETENQYSKHDGSISKILNSHTRGKYIAYCEGDDYWTDPLKLQKQFNALENNSNASICYTAFQNIDEENNKIIRPDYEIRIKNSFSGDIFPVLLLKGNFILTCTTFIKKDVLENIPYKKLSLDYSLFLAASAVGLGIFIPDYTACYRKNHNGLCETQLRYIQNTIWNIKLETFKDYISNPKLKREIYDKEIKIEALKHAIIKKRLLEFLDTNPRLFLLLPFAFYRAIKTYFKHH